MTLLILNLLTPCTVNISSDLVPCTPVILASVPYPNKSPFLMLAFVSRLSSSSKSEGYEPVVEFRSSSSVLGKISGTHPRESAPRSPLEVFACDDIKRAASGRSDTGIRKMTPGSSTDPFRRGKIGKGDLERLIVEADRTTALEMMISRMITNMSVQIISGSLRAVYCTILSRRCCRVLHLSMKLRHVWNTYSDSDKPINVRIPL